MLNASSVSCVVKVHKYLKKRSLLQEKPAWGNDNSGFIEAIHNGIEILTPLTHEWNFIFKCETIKIPYTYDTTIVFVVIP